MGWKKAGCNIFCSSVAFHFQPITDDDVDRIATCLRVLAERSDLMQEIFNEACRGSLSVMLAAKIEEDKAAQEVQHFLSLIFSQQYCFIGKPHLFVFKLSLLQSF